MRRYCLITLFSLLTFYANSQDFSFSGFKLGEPIPQEYQNALEKGYTANLGDIEISYYLVKLDSIPEFKGELTYGSITTIDSLVGSLHFHVDISKFTQIGDMMIQKLGRKYVFPIKDVPFLIWNIDDKSAHLAIEEGTCDVFMSTENCTQIMLLIKTALLERISEEKED